MGLGALEPTDTVEVPPTPAGLSPEAVEVWQLVWTAYPAGVLSPELDSTTVERLCRLTDQRAALVAAVEERGALLEEPIQNARGEILEGVHVVANPALAMIAKTDRAIDAIGAQIGTSPAARARLGLVMAYAQQASAGARRVLAGMTKETA